MSATFCHFLSTDAGRRERVDVTHDGGRLIQVHTRGCNAADVTKLLSDRERDLIVRAIARRVAP